MSLGIAGLEALIDSKMPLQRRGFLDVIWGDQSIRPRSATVSVSLIAERCFEELLLRTTAEPFDSRDFFFSTARPNRVLRLSRLLAHGNMQSILVRCAITATTLPRQSQLHVSHRRPFLQSSDRYTVYFWYIETATAVQRLKRQRAADTRVADGSSMSKSVFVTTLTIYSRTYIELMSQRDAG